MRFSIVFREKPFRQSGEPLQEGASKWIMRVRERADCYEKPTNSWRRANQETTRILGFQPTLHTIPSAVRHFKILSKSSKMMRSMKIKFALCQIRAKLRKLWRLEKVFFANLRSLKLQIFNRQCLQKMPMDSIAWNHSVTTFTCPIRVTLKLIKTDQASNWLWQTVANDCHARLGFAV